MIRSVVRTLCVCSALLAVCATVPAAERYEHRIDHEVAIPQGGSLVFENLIGSLTVRGDRTGGKAIVQAQVVVETEDRATAHAIFDSIQVSEHRDGSELTLRVDYPVDRYSSYKLPRSEKGGLLSKWVTPLVRKRTVAAVYDGRTIEAGSGKGALPIAVHLQITVPMDVKASMKQIVGTTQATALRGNFLLEVVEGEIVAEQIYGSLETRSGGGNVILRKYDGKELRVHTGSGDVEMTDVRAEVASFRTGSGELRGSSLQIGTLQVESSEGGVHLSDLDPVSIRIRTVSGEVDLAAEITRLRDADIRTDSGDVTLRVNRATPFGFYAEATEGSVKFGDLAVEVLEEQENLLRLQRGQGGAEIRVTTGKGEVLVRPL